MRLLKCSLLGAKLGKIINNIIFPFCFILILKVSRPFTAINKPGIIDRDVQDSLEPGLGILVKVQCHSLHQKVTVHYLKNVCLFLLPC